MRGHDQALTLGPDLKIPGVSSSRTHSTLQHMDTDFRTHLCYKTACCLSPVVNRSLLNVWYLQRGVSPYSEERNPHGGSLESPFGPRLLQMGLTPFSSHWTVPFQPTQTGKL